MNLRYGKRPDSARTADCKSINVSFRTSAHTGVGIPLVQPDTFQNLCHSEPVLFPGVGISLVQQTAFSKNVSFRTSAHTGVGISFVIETASP